MPMDPPKALFAPIMVDRFYENTKATDGTDIGSRAKHREYMKRNNLTTIDDFSDEWRSRRKAEVERSDQRERRDILARETYKKFS
jgi:hypothetical protein